MPTSSRSSGGETFSEHKFEMSIPLETDHVQVYLKNNKNSGVNNNIKEKQNQTNEIKIKNYNITSIKNSSINQFSSMDSTKEDNLLANFGHSSTASIIIIPSNMDLSSNIESNSKEKANKSERHYIDKNMRFVRKNYITTKKFYY